MPIIEALHVFDEAHTLILSHTWTGRPPSPQTILPLYLTHTTPRPSLIYEASINPPTLIHSIIQDRLLFLGLTSSDSDPLIILEFLHRLADAFTDILGSPLLAHKITSSYDVLAQLLPEACDAGSISTTEPNALRDLIDNSSWVKSLLGVPTPSLQSGLNPSRNDAPAIPWRRANVKHTSNEMYVDMLETLHVITAPSGAPLAAFAHGSVIFTAKISGVPDISLTLGTNAGGPSALGTLIQLPVFHPCVRLARWNSRPGELSFVPPDGKFVLLSYEVDLLGTSHLDNISTKAKKKSQQLALPATVSLRRDPANPSVFTIHLHLNHHFAPSTGTGRPDAFSKAPGLTGQRVSGTSAHPTVDDIVVRVPIPVGVRSLGDLKTSRGEVRWAPGMDTLEWRVNGKEIAGTGHGISGEVAARLRCVVQGESVASTDADEPMEARWQYDEDGSDRPEKHDKKTVASKDTIKGLMPSSASVSFQVKGWLASGVKVDKLVIDVQRSRGLGPGVQPYKGVKYMTVSQNGVETRC